MTQTLFITGATGNIGGKILLETIERNPDARIIALVRAESQASAWRRLLHTLQILAPEIDVTAVSRRVRVVCGDITEELLGLSESDWRQLASQVTHVIHSAASTQFTLPIECARKVNYSGTVNVMQFARCAAASGQLENVGYIGTAYVCGDRGGIISEVDPIGTGQFSNAYEQSKAEAETYVRSLMTSLPITILRPSIVVGDSRTGRTVTLNVLYTPLRLICKGVVRDLTCNPATRLDVVPLDYVASATVRIVFQSSSIGKTFHITAGSSAPTVGEIVGGFIDYACQNHPELRERLSALRYSDGNSAGNARSFQLIAPFAPYLQIDRTFDTSNTFCALAGSGIDLPRFSGYLENLFEYCFAVDWGRALRQAA
jgi:thioester reductase-like protein